MNCFLYKQTRLIRIAFNPKCLMIRIDNPFFEKELCDRLGPLSSLCVQFVNTTGKQIIDELIAGLVS